MPIFFDALIHCFQRVFILLLLSPFACIYFFFYFCRKWKSISISTIRKLDFNLSSIVSSIVFSKWEWNYRVALLKNGVYDEAHAIIHSIRTIKVWDFMFSSSPFFFFFYHEWKDNWKEFLRRSLRPLPPIRCNYSSLTRIKHVNNPLRNN